MAATLPEGVPSSSVGDSGVKDPLLDCRCHGDLLVTYAVESATVEHTLWGALDEDLGSGSDAAGLLRGAVS